MLAEQVVGRQRDGGRQCGRDTQRRPACCRCQTSATRASPTKDSASAAQTRLRTGWRKTKRAHSATISGAVYSSSSAMLTGIRAIATK